MNKVLVSPHVFGKYLCAAHARENIQNRCRPGTRLLQTMYTVFSCRMLTIHMLIKQIYMLPCTYVLYDDETRYIAPFLVFTVHCIIRCTVLHPDAVQILEELSAYEL